MKKIVKIFGILLLIFSMVFVFGCGQKPNQNGPKKDDPNTPPAPTEMVDYVSQLKFNPNSGRKWEEVTVKGYVDGDTTHFFVPTSICEDGILKARYLAINTPESTGQIEPWGKEASNFTHEKLSSAVSIIIESNDGKWNLDSTGGRYLVFVWYKSSSDSDYRCLNLEILQEGLAVASNIGSTCYASVCQSALNQAKTNKIKVHSNEQAPGFYYGSAKEVSLKEIRINTLNYLNIKVAFEGVVTKVTGGTTAYVEDYDAEDDTTYGIQVYMGFNPIESIAVGNRVRIVGTVQKYESEYGITYQVSGLKYYPTRPNHEDNTKLISSGHDVNPTLISVNDFNNKIVNVIVKDGEEEKESEMNLSDLIIYTFVEMKGLQVQSCYTTESGSSKGAITLTCKYGDQTITIRTGVLYETINLVDENGEPLVDENGNQLTDKVVVEQSRFIGKTIDIRGIVDVFNGKPQVKVYSISDITIH